MLEKLKQSWRDFEEDTPGERFQDYYKRRRQSHQSTWRKALFIGGGLLVMAAGTFMLVVPGPGLLVIFIGAALIAQQSLLAARALDWLELRLRELTAWSLRRWCRASPVVKALLVVLTVALVGAAVFGAYVLLFGQVAGASPAHAAGHEAYFAQDESAT